MLGIIIIHAVMAVCAPLVVHRLGRQAFVVMALAPASAFVYALWSAPAVLSGKTPKQSCRGSLLLDWTSQCDSTHCRG